MRIAIVPTSPGAVFPAPKSHSIARIMETLIKGLQERGHQVTLLAPASSQVECELIPICDHPIFLQDDKDLILTQKIQEQMLQELKKITHRLDIIHAHSLDIPGIFHSTGLLNAFNFPNITTFHSCIDITNINYFEKCHNNLVSVSNNQREASPNLNYIQTVYNGLDPNPFPFVKTPENYLCFLGRISKVKQPNLAIQLAIKLGIKLKIAGLIDPFFDQDFFEKECLPYFDHPLIEYLGELDMKEKIQLISKAKCNLHPTGFRDPCPLSILESAYCGTPTLAIKRGSLPELIEDGQTGILVEDYAEGYYKIAKCFDMDRHYISQRARTLFNYQVMTEQYILAYEKVIKKV